MTMQAIRQFAVRTYPHATGLAGLVAALDAKASGTPLNPALAARIGELLAALGAGGILDDLSAEEARALVYEIRCQLRSDALLLDPDTRGTNWSYADPRLLQDVGDFARSHAQIITKQIAPALEGMSARLGAPGARFLDVGVGVAGTAITLAQLWPELSVVGIDVWQPSLKLARENVARAGLKERVELREQAIEQLEEAEVYDAVWLPQVFLPERVVPVAIERCLRALRPGGWIILAFVSLEGVEPQAAALWRLRCTMYGGTIRTVAEIEQGLREKGFTEVKTLPRHPGVPAGFAVGRRPV